MMDYPAIGRSKLGISQIGLGGIPFGGHYGEMGKREVTRTVRAAIDAGITFFDTSPSYGDGLAETLLGEALGSDRDAVVVATKLDVTPDAASGTLRKLDRPTIVRQIEASLRRLHREVIDVYFVNGADLRTPIRGTIEAIEGLRHAGKIRLVGLCTDSMELIRETLQYGRLEVVLAPYNILNRTIETSLIPFCRATNISILACEPFCRGILFGKMHRNSVFDIIDLRVEDRRFRGDRFRQNIEIVNRLQSLAHQEGLSMAQLALGWSLQNAVVSAAVCGAKSTHQINEIANAAAVQLTPDQIITIDQIAGEDIREQVA